MASESAEGAASRLRKEAEEGQDMSADELLGLINAHKDSADVQAAGCWAIKERAKQCAEWRTKLAETGAVQAVLRAMEQHREHAGVQECGCRALACLAINSNDNKVRIATEGGIRSILDAMGQHREHAGVQECGCRALWSLAANNGDNQVSIAAEGGIRSILDAMGQHREHAGVQEAGCGALRNLACNNDNQVSIAAESGIRSILDTMEQHRQHAGVQEAGCVTLRNLACNNDNQVSIAKQGGIGVMLDAMKQHREHADVQEAGCGALWSLAVNNSDNQVSIAAEGGIGLMLDAMKQHREHAGVQENGCRALWSLAVNDDNQVSIAKQGGIGVMLDAMKQHREHAGVQKQVYGALSSLAANNSDNQVSIAKQGGIGLMLDAMKQHREHVGVQQQANNALSMLASDNEVSVASALKAIGTHVFSQHVVDKACHLLLLRNSDFQRLFSPSGATVVVLRVLSNYRSSRAVQETGLETLYRLTQRDGDNTPISDNLSVIIAAMQEHPESDRVQTFGCELLQLITAGLSNSAKKRTADQGGNHVLIAAMTTHPDSASIQLQALKALAHFISMPELKAQVAETEAESLAREALHRHSNSSDIVEWARKVVGAFSTAPSWQAEGIKWWHKDWHLDHNLDCLLKWRQGEHDGVLSAPLSSDTLLYQWIASQVNGNGVTLSRVEITKSSALVGAFQNRLRQTRIQRAKAGSKFNHDFGAGDSVKRSMLERMKEQFVQSAEDSKVDVLLAWHGCSEEAASDITAGGTANLSEANDPGFFGTGIYLTPQAKYAAGYACNAFGDTLEPPNANGEHVLLLCAVAVRLAYPITRAADYRSGSGWCSFNGRNLHRCCDTHYVHVAAASGFQAPQDHTRFNFEEIVVSQEAQVLPFAKVHVTLDHVELTRFLHSPPTEYMPVEQ